MFEYIEKIITLVKNNDYTSAKKEIKKLSRFTDYYTIYMLLSDYLNAEQLKRLFN